MLQFSPLAHTHSTLQEEEDWARRGGFPGTALRSDTPLALHGRVRKIPFSNVSIYSPKGELFVPGLVQSRQLCAFAI